MDWYSEEIATFGDRLAGAREAANLSQKELAGHLGVKTDVVRGWEEDRKEPRANRLQMMSGLLGVSLSWLMSGEGEGVAAPGDENEISSDLTAMLTELRGLRAEVLKTADRMGVLEKRLRTSLKEVEA